MKFQIQAFALVVFILLSITVSKSIQNFGARSFFSPRAITYQEEPVVGLETPAGKKLSYEQASLSEVNAFFIPKTPTRDWNVLDPALISEIVSIRDLSADLALFSYNTEKPWPAASLTKLMTALAVLKEIGKSRKIEVSTSSVLTEGTAGNLKVGEIYTTEDLLKIMLLTSSNDAATLFEENLGKEVLVRYMNEEAKNLKMSQTVFYDASGLSDANQTSATDIQLLLAHLLKENPEVLSWTRIPSFIVQPLNGTENRTVLNINPLVKDTIFLGGKTGTSDLARQNLATLISLGDRKLGVVILGSNGRTREMENLIIWLKRAYPSLF